MPTECIPQQLEFQGHGYRMLVADFPGGRIASGAGGLLLGEVAYGLELLERFAGCFVDPFRRAYTQAPRRIIVGLSRSSPLVARIAKQMKTAKTKYLENSRVGPLLP